MYCILTVYFTGVDARIHVDASHIDSTGKSEPRRENGRKPQHFCLQFASRKDFHFLSGRVKLPLSILIKFTVFILASLSHMSVERYKLWQRLCEAELAIRLSWKDMEGSQR